MKVPTTLGASPCPLNGDRASISGKKVEIGVGLCLNHTLVPIAWKKLSCV